MMIATWTQERVEQLRSFVNAGLTCSQIADEIGVSRNAVIGKIHRLGLSPGRTAAAPARERPPRDRRPRFLRERHALRLVHDEVPCASDAAMTTAPTVESTQRCSLLDLTERKCRWPISDPGKTDFAFCGNDSIEGLSYCAGHARMAYRVATRRRA